MSDDEARVQIQMSQTEIALISASMVPGASSGGGAGPFGTTSFEGHELNSMIDLVDSANHTDLENAGSALWKARDALKEAARELKGYIDEVEWQGESGTEFRTFGTKFAKHAVSLADFADVAGTQITVAGTGLASVRSAMPARDGRLVKKKADDIPLPGRVEGNAEYSAALKVEKDRQEAINQMYRLASFYAVSEERLAAQEPPVFDGALDANVPPPRVRRKPVPSSGASVASIGLSGDSVPQTVSERPGFTGNAEAHRVEGLDSTPLPDRSVVASALPTGIVPGSESPSLPDQDASLEINSVTAPSVPRENSTSSSTPIGSGSSPTTAGGGSGVTPSYTGTGLTPFHSGAPRASGPADVPRAVGRPGGAGGVPAAGGSASGRPSAGGSTGPRGGRAEGVVGGNPRAAGGSSGSRIPRGTVVGGEGASPGRSVGGRAGQKGVVGANPAKGSARAGGRGSGSSNGVVGTPRGSAPGSRSRGGSFTQGGTGLVRGPGRSGPEKEEKDPTDSSRPDYLTEDEETWTGRRRGAVPPVVE